MQPNSEARAPARRWRLGNTALSQVLNLTQHPPGLMTQGAMAPISLQSKLAVWSVEQGKDGPCWTDQWLVNAAVLSSSAAAQQHGQDRELCSNTQMVAVQGPPCWIHSRLTGLGRRGTGGQLDGLHIPR